MFGFKRNIKKEKYFNNTFLHRVVPNFIIQAGSSDLKSTFKKTKDRDNQKRIIKEYEQVKVDIENITILISTITARNNEVNYMKNIHNLEQLKDFMKSRAYWADEWSISKIEKILNIII